LWKIDETTKFAEIFFVIKKNILPKLSSLISVFEKKLFWSPAIRIRVLKEPAILIGSNLVLGMWWREYLGGKCCWGCDSENSQEETYAVGDLVKRIAKRIVLFEMWWGGENSWEESSVGDVVKRIAKRKVL
jgi:hypothetical protein